jgi:hypothetical protein
MVDTAGRSGQRLYVQVDGLERLAEVDSSGRFAIADLPAGTFVVRVVRANDTPVALASGIAVGSGERTDVAIRSGWHFSTRLYLNTTATGANIAENIANFPLLVRLDGSTSLTAGSANFDFSQAGDSGQDVRFANANGSYLPYEIEQWDRTGQHAVVWVRMDTVCGNSDRKFMVMQWGNPSAASESNGAALFDTANGFVGVWHFSDCGTAVRRNSAQDQFHARPANYTGNESVEGMIGVCDSLDSIAHDTLGVINITDQIEISAWVNEAREVDFARIIAKDIGDSHDEPYAVYSLNYDSLNPPNVVSGLTFTDGHVARINTNVSPMLVNEWHYLCVTWDGAMERLFVDGEQTDSMITTGTLVSNDTPTLIAWEPHVDWQKFQGKIDEVRISKTGRSAAWVRLCYENQKPYQTLVGFAR